MRSDKSHCIEAVVYMCSHCGLYSQHKSNMSSHVSKKEGARIVEGRFSVSKDCLSVTEGAIASASFTVGAISMDIDVSSLYSLDIREDDHRIRALLYSTNGQDTLRQIYNGLTEGVVVCFATFIRMCVGKESGDLRSARIHGHFLEWGCHKTDNIIRRRIEWRSILDFLIQVYDTFHALCVVHSKRRHDIPRDIRGSAELLEECLDEPIFKRTTKEYRLHDMLQSRRRNLHLEHLVSLVLESL